MTERNSVDYYKLNPLQKLLCRIAWIIRAVPTTVALVTLAFFKWIKNSFLKIINTVTELIGTFRHGNILTRISYFIMGFGHYFRGQPFRGILFTAFQLIFILYMVFFGLGFLSKLHNLGDVAAVTVINEYGLEVVEYRDNSLKILLYSTLTIFFCIGFESP